MKMIVDRDKGADMFHSFKSYHKQHDIALTSIGKTNNNNNNKVRKC